jgi:hypothetical protein
MYALHTPNPAAEKSDATFVGSLTSPLTEVTQRVGFVMALLSFADSISWIERF